MQTDRKKVRQKDNSYPRGLQSHCCLHTPNTTGRPEKAHHVCPESQKYRGVKFKGQDSYVTSNKIQLWGISFNSAWFHNVCKQFECSSERRVHVSTTTAGPLSETLAESPRLKVHHVQKIFFRYGVSKLGLRYPAKYTTLNCYCASYKCPYKTGTESTFLSSSSSGST